MALAPEKREKLVKILGLLSSEHMGERASAGAMAQRIVTEAGLQWADVVTIGISGDTRAKPKYQRPEPEWEPAPPPEPIWHKFAREVIDSGRATSWEIGFCETLLGYWEKSRISEKQQAIFERIYQQRVRAYQGR